MTAFEAYLDMYVLTGNSTYLKAVQGAWEMFRESFLHLGGAMALNEGSIGNSPKTGNPAGIWYPPGSYYLEGDSGAQGKGVHLTGETCGTVFWIKLNQRFHGLFPDDDRYVAEIERSLINIGIANQAPEVGVKGAGIRYFALLNGHKEKMTNYSSCCEGQGTRLHGSLPEYIFSVPTAAANHSGSSSGGGGGRGGGGGLGLYVDLLMSATIDMAAQTAAADATVPPAASTATAVAAINASFTVVSRFPFPQGAGEAVTIRAAMGGATTALENFTLSIRLPAWLATPHVDVRLVSKAGANMSYAVGKRGSYLHLKRNWVDGDAVEVHGVQQELKASKYTGLSQVVNSTRFGFEYGMPTRFCSCH